MLTLNYDDLNEIIPMVTKRFAVELGKSLEEIMFRKYDYSLLERRKQDYSYAIIRQLPFIFYVASLLENKDLPDIEHIKGKVILDLGCGSICSADNKNLIYEPWLCRILMELGAMPIGIDKAAQSRDEIFEYHKADLLSGDSLRFIQSKSVDIANASALFDSPSLLRSYMETNNGRGLKVSLMPQLENVLKPRSIFLYSDVA